MSEKLKSFQILTVRRKNKSLYYQQDWDVKVIKAVYYCHHNYYFLASYFTASELTVEKNSPKELEIN